VPECSVPECTKEAAYEVIIYDFYPHNGHVYFEQDLTCPYICTEHAMKNERDARGERKPRGLVIYPYTNQLDPLGLTIYKPL
jgi:hypothetical protein